jgi:glycosyltransferase involved in cell wall biosynthesis
VKLLIYSHYFTPSVGGVETIVTLLARKLSGTGKTPGAGAAAAAAENLEVTVATQTPASNFDDRTLPFPVIRTPSVFQLWRLIRSADVIHIAGPSLAPMILAKLARTPYVVEHHGYQAICPNGVLIHQPDRAICPGHFQAHNYGACIRCQQQEMSTPHALVKLLLMFPRHSLSRTADSNIFITHHSLKRHRLPHAQVIYYGIGSTQDSDSQNERSSPLARDSNPDPACFAYVGRLVPEKGLDVLLRAASLLKDAGLRFQILLIGDGPERANLESQIAANNLHDIIRITGFLRGSALTAQMSTVDAVVMPSIWEETAGLAAIEQMMRGRLVIASDIGGLGEVVGDAGLKFPAGDAQRLADQMKKVIQNTEEVAALGKLAQGRAQSLFRADRMAAEHTALYSRLL